MIVSPKGSVKRKSAQEYAVLVRRGIGNRKELDQVSFSANRAMSPNVVAFLYSVSGRVEANSACERA